MNVNKERSAKTVMILNHTVLGLTFGSMVVDTIKMVFAADSDYDLNIENEVIDEFN